MPSSPTARGTPESVVREFHEVQGRFYAGGPADPLAERLTEEVVWHVPGRNRIAGDHRGRERVLDYFALRRELTDATFRVKVGAIMASGDAVVQFADGEAEREGRRLEWRTVGVFRVADAQIAECWLIPLDQPAFDEAWS